MDPITLSIITSLATNYFTHFTAPQLESFFRSAFQRKPSLEAALKSANSTHDLEKIFQEAVGVVEASAGNGSIEIENAIIKAIKGIRFDHQDGTVTIDGTKLSAQVLQTGGSGKGKTLIRASNMKSRGTEIKMGANTAIKISGNAKITQN